jgi:serine/threonine-protein kinase
MSPEQCRALPLDGRSDLYSVGVNLFVLLTGRLPFEATTPPEHMLKHLVEPAPDPRQVAPDRGISEALAGVVLRALAKSPQDRFQSASEMSDALSRARADLGAAAPRSAASAPPPAARCPHCGETLDPGFKFCGACGGRVSLAPGMRPDAPAVLVDILEPAPGAAAPVSRDADLAWVLERVADGGGGPSAVAVVGPTGIGKIRLLRSLIDRERLRQRFVVLVEPDPWRLGALHHALRSAVGHLLALDGDGEVAATIAQASGPARLGMLELFDAPGGAGAREHASTAERPAGVLAALAWAVRRAADREGPPLVVLEDLDAMDHASRQTFAMAMTCEPALPASWVASFAPSFDPRWPAAIPRRSLVPLAADAAAGTLGRQEGAAVARGPDAGLPLYADHAARFAREGGSLPPPCLGDLVALRLSRLPAVLRRLLQAMAVLGDRAEVSEVAALCAGVDVRRSLEALARAGLAEADGDRARFSHPMVRQIAIGTTPAAVARELYRAATALASAPRLPIEVRAAWHLGADDAFEALVLLDQIGARALRRAEPDAAVDAYGRALRVARLDVGRGELDDSQSAVVGFSRKLAGALGAAGRARDAEAVLREALGFCEDSQGARAHVLEALYELLRAAGRKTEAADCLAGAVAAARQLGDKQLAGRLARRGLDEMS